MPDQNMPVKTSPEQITYANILFLGAWFGIFLMVLTYFIYAAGILTPHVPMETVIQNWDKGVTEYLHTTHSPHGWNWVNLLNRGDFLNFIGIVLLASLTVICYLTLLPAYVRSKDWTYFTICLLEVIVLCVAASGILGVGGH